MSEPWPVHTVVFDLDDTLYPERDYVLSGFAAADAWLKKNHGIGGLAVRSGELFAAGRRGKIFDDALRHLGVADPAPLVPQLVEAYRVHVPNIGLYSETVKVLIWAKQHFRLALISDGYLEVQRRKAAALGLERWIDCLIFTDQWGREAWKPSERSFREVMNRLPGEAGRYVYVSDNPRKDFIAPRRLGWRTLRLRRAGGEHADYQPAAGEAAERDIDSLAELPALLSPAGSP